MAGSGGTAKIRLIGDYSCFDPAAVKCAATSGSKYINLAFYATLIAWDGSKAVPYLATSWQTTTTSVTFTLRKDVTCSDGTPLTPTVVKNSFQRLIDVKAAFLASNFGPGPYSTSADDAAGTFTFTVGAAYRDLLYGFTDVGTASLVAPVVCPAGLANPDSLVTQPSGAGPYVLVEAVHGDHVTAKLRPDFSWGPYGITAKTPGIPETVVYKVVADDTTAANLILTGDLDFVELTNPAEVERLTANTSLHSKLAPTLMASRLVYNELPSHVTSDKAVRQALSTAVDRNAYRKAAANGLGALATSYVPKGAPCYSAKTESLVPEPSVASAQAILSSAGWTLSQGKFSKNGRALAININFDSREGAALDYLVNVWNQMGATVTVVNTDLAQFGATNRAGNFDVANFPYGSQGFPAYAVMTWEGFPDPPAGSNYGRVHDPVIVKALAGAGSASTDADACANWATYQEQLLTEWHVLPTYIASNNFFTSPSFEMARVASTPVIPLRIRRVKP